MTRIYPYPPSENKVKWISTDWLQEHFEDYNLMILDVQPSFQDYAQEHISDAIYMDEKLLRAPQRGLPAVYVPPEYIQPIFRRLGLKPDVPVIVYSGVGAVSKEGDGLAQSMVAYSLVRFGHDNVYVLDGGIDKWKQEGKPLTKIIPAVIASDFKVEICKEYFHTYEKFKQVKDNDDVLLLDVRSPDAYEGRSARGKPGHIPGAVNLPRAAFFNKENSMLLKFDEEIQAVIEAYGVTPDKTIICSCSTGRTAISVFILFKWYLRYPKVRIYEGSFSEWASYPENSVVISRNPR
jgi:thiosulfate/3-mercaptopyruvate sulfurtransferase